MFGKNALTLCCLLTFASADDDLDFFAASVRERARPGGVSEWKGSKILHSNQTDKLLSQCVTVLRGLGFCAEL